MARRLGYSAGSLIGSSNVVTMPTIIVLGRQVSRPTEVNMGERGMLLVRIIGMHVQRSRLRYEVARDDQQC